MQWCIIIKYKVYRITHIIGTLSTSSFIILPPNNKHLLGHVSNPISNTQHTWCCGSGKNNKAIGPCFNPISNTQHTWCCGSGKLRNGLSLSSPLLRCLPAINPPNPECLQGVWITSSPSCIPLSVHGIVTHHTNRAWVVKMWHLVILLFSGKSVVSGCSIARSLFVGQNAMEGMLNRRDKMDPSFQVRRLVLFTYPRAPTTIPGRSK